MFSRVLIATRLDRQQLLGLKRVPRVREEYVELGEDAREHLPQADRTRTAAMLGSAPGEFMGDRYEKKLK